MHQYFKLIFASSYLINALPLRKYQKEGHRIRAIKMRRTNFSENVIVDIFNLFQEREALPLEMNIIFDTARMVQAIALLVLFLIVRHSVIKER